jgi:hypothetical protein
VYRVNDDVVRIRYELNNVADEKRQKYQSQDIVPLRTQRNEFNKQYGDKIVPNQRISSKGMPVTI